MVSMESGGSPSPQLLVMVKFYCLFSFFFFPLAPLLLGKGVSGCYRGGGERLV